MSNPYVDLPERAFWKPAVASRSLFDLRSVWHPKFFIEPSDVFVTFGSCFAQHIGRALSARGFSWFNAEPAPNGLSDENSRRFNYGIFSARTANMYTTSILEQWTRWATGAASPSSEAWKRDGRVYDPFRPVIEPGGFISAGEMQASRAVAIAAFRRCIETADYFVFTLGLTESWKNAADGHEYPMCPGTAAGTFDPKLHIFENQSVVEIMACLERAMEMMRDLNPKLKFLLTVSPVPLTATNSGNHVMVATMESKSILRAAAGQLARSRPDTDYFPSYELINSPVIKGTFFDPNQRDVNARGVSFVMDNFFEGVQAKQAEKAPPPVLTKKQIALAAAASVADAKASTDAKAGPDDVVCEEELLAAFGGR